MASLLLTYDQPPSGSAKQRAAVGEACQAYVVPATTVPLRAIESAT